MIYRVRVFTGKNWKFLPGKFKSDKEALRSKAWKIACDNYPDFKIVESPIIYNR